MPHPSPTFPRPEPPPDSWRARLGPAAAILFAGLFAFWPALSGAWLWDDAAGIARNPDFRTVGGLQRIWLGATGADYLPAKDTLLWLEWQLWGARAVGFHAVGLALHLGCAFLLWGILRRLGVARGWLAGLVFAVHPLAVAAVGRISELRHPLSLLFLLLAFDAYLAQDRPGAGPAGERAYRASLLWFLLALLSDTAGVMFPAVLLLYSGWRRGAVTRREVRAAAPFCGISLLLGLTALWLQQHRAGAGPELALAGMAWRLAAAGRAVVFYLRQCVWPWRLLPLYPRWPADVFGGATLGAGAALAALALGLARLPRPARGAALLAGGWFLLNLLPVLGLVRPPALRASWVEDPYAYLPLAGLVGAAGAALDAGFARRRRRALLAALVVFGAGALAAASHRYARQFADEVALWSYGVRGNPDSGEAHLNLANARAQTGHYAAALPEYEEAARLQPDDPILQYDFGNALLRAGLTDEAIARYRLALGLRPAYAEAEDNLGIALQARGQLPEALAHFEAAVRLKPASPDLHYNLGNALLRSNRPVEAVAEYELVRKALPNRVQVHYNLGLALLQARRFPEAIAEYQETLRLAPGSAEAHNNLGNALLQNGQRADAIVEYEEALRLNPNFAGAKHDLQFALRQLPAATLPPPGRK